MTVDTLTDGDPVSSASPSPPVALRRFTRDEYDRMIAIGLFDEDEHLELIDGEVVETTPQGSKHSTSVYLVHGALAAIFRSGCLVRAQMPLALDELSEPEPDVAVIEGNPRDYSDEHPSRALMVVEVSDSTLDFDRGRKLALYARCGVPESWIVNLTDGALEIYREPSGSTYRVAMRVPRDGFVSPQARPNERIAVADILP